MAILSEVSLGDTISFIVVDDNPNSVPVDCFKGSLICWVDKDIPNFNPILHYKTTDGPTTDVIQIVTRDMWDATVDPAPTDNVLFGFNTGSRWFNTTTGKLFTKVATGLPPIFSATWVQVN